MTATAQSIPQQVYGVSTVNQNNNVNISWSEPYSGGLGIPIVAYDIKI